MSKPAGASNSIHKGGTVKFESARDLKEEALARFIVPTKDQSIGPRIQRRLRAAQVSIAGRASSGWREDLFVSSFGVPQLHPQPRVGVGVAVLSSENYQLAVRYPWFDTSDAPFAAELTDLAAGEVNFKWTGPIRAGHRGIHARPERQRHRPLTIGCSVAHDRGTAGTVCAFVSRGDGAPELLSCNHVLADCDRAQPNSAILQPGPVDFGGPTDVVGRLAYAYPLERRADNIVDCAVATLDTGIAAEPSLIGDAGVLKGLVDPGWYGKPAEGQHVSKLGRTTGHTQGTVTTISQTLEIEYAVGLRSFADLMEVTGLDGAFAYEGDSGALVYTHADRDAVGMVIAVAEDGTAYMTRLDTVLSRLGANLVL